MTRNPSDSGWVESQEAQDSIPPWRDEGGKPRRRAQRQPTNWPTAVLGIAALAFVALVLWLLFDLIRDLAG